MSISPIFWVRNIDIVSISAMAISTYLDPRIQLKSDMHSPRSNFKDALYILGVFGQ